MSRASVLACLAMLVILLASAAAGAVAHDVMESGGLYPVNLRTEYHTDPLGIDETQPRLSWELRSADASRRGQAQSAYQILVASSREKLEAREGDLWDSGKVESDQTNQVIYKGRPLASRQAAWWSVRTWDERGEASEWSPPARWTMGLLEPSDWSARWIGFDAPAENAEREAALDLEGARWVWLAAAAPQGATERRYFRRSIRLPHDRTVTRATFLGTADNRL